MLSARMFFEGETGILCRNKFESVSLWKQLLPGCGTLPPQTTAESSGAWKTIAADASVLSKFPMKRPVQMDTVSR